MLFREMIQEELLKLATFWIPSKELRHKIRASAFSRFQEGALPTHYGDKKIYDGQEASDVIYEELQKDKPSLICRFGGNEYFTMRNYWKENGLYYPRALKKAMHDGAGFWPTTRKNLSKFSKMIIDLCKDIDILGVWALLDEKEFCINHLKNSKFVVFNNICPISVSNPWTKFLKNKKVLVIHPCTETIEKQYQKRELLFTNPDILPEFELKTLKAVQSIADEKENLPYKNWFEALEYMKSEIDKIDFDIAIIGAGAYGIFLAQHCKKIGKKAIHMGGTTQLIFGILGKRWEHSNPEPFFAQANLKHWVRPSDSEKPKGYEKVESGCYW